MSINWSKIIRQHLASVTPYSTARSEFSGEASVFLDANENSFGSVVHGLLHRYPDPVQTSLRKALAEQNKISVEEVFIGHGSDEAIELLIRACCEPGVDQILITPPTYGMYEVSARINNVEVVRSALGDGYQLNVDDLISRLTPTVKLVFLCSPNNPTGNALNLDDIERVLKKSSCLVVVDQAYIDFCPERSTLSLLRKYENLVVLQTLSKAWGLAALRVGMAFANPKLISLLLKIKPPYNISGPTQSLALRALGRTERRAQVVESIVQEREALSRQLTSISGVERVYPSDANFLLVQCRDSQLLYHALCSQGIIVRDRSETVGCEGCVRITVGTPLENQKLLKAVAEFYGSSILEAAVAPERRGVIHRKTSETDVQIDLVLDGRGETAVSTGLAFFDHMLEQLGKHSGMDLAIAVIGDLDIDEHHTVEDTALALGAALAQALGDKRGIERYGFCAPMDEARAEVLLDFSGRPYLQWDVSLSREYVGDLPCELLEHFFRSFAESARLTLHISADGENEHHIIEGIFKALARALREAMKRSATGTDIPSTKGVL